MKKTSTLLILCIIFVSNVSFASTSKQYNIYLIPSSQAKIAITSFNKVIAKDGLFDKYHTQPFTQKFPVHLSLYITGFNTANLQHIKDEITKIAHNNNSFEIRTKKLTVGKSGFVMLDVNNNIIMQKISNTIVNKLSVYRDKSYSMPSWVNLYPDKKNTFYKYGSPNVFKQFDPHFSILAAKLGNAKSKHDFVSDFNKYIAKYNLKHTNIKIIGIGLGEVNNDGQVTKTLQTDMFK